MLWSSNFIRFQGEEKSIGNQGDSGPTTGNGEQATKELVMAGKE